MTLAEQTHRTPVTLQEAWPLTGAVDVPFPSPGGDIEKHFLESRKMAH